MTAIHVVEHLPYEQLERLFLAARTALRPGGVFVAETINPHSLSAFKTFWVDPTHRAPIFPEVAHALALIHGFERARIRYPRGSGDGERDRDRADRVRPRGHRLRAVSLPAGTPGSGTGCRASGCRRCGSSRPGQPSA